MGLARRAGVESAPPLVSIVVPVYNVAPYLTECLASILAQPLPSYEVVLVDDGSTDGSGAIAADIAAHHGHVRLLRQPNAGLGAARNAGARASRGTYLTFVDSDDVLPAGAYTTMLATLETTGSDFAVGMLERDDGIRRFATPRMRRNHRVERLGIRLEEFPEILADVFAVNKIFRRSFWDTAQLQFPVGVRYEDQPTLTAAYLRARAFDVVRETVYLWRIRSDRTSITQQRHDIADLRDRIVTKRSANALLAGAPSHVRRVWTTDVLPVDMWEYFRSVPGCSEEYWTMLVSAVREFWPSGGVPFERALIPVQQRLMGWFVAQDRRADLEALLDFIDSRLDGLPMQARDGRIMCLLPGHEDAGVVLPRELYELGEHEQPPRRTAGSLSAAGAR
ncbi:MAG: hypothetical protein QOK15_2378 [Nocardioidaceae bacterium]|jgi:CDP-glycerol glycerophosphotransferase|nr:hypothetical protein [Nocardioidaceae bacterium]